MSALQLPRSSSAFTADSLEGKPIPARIWQVPDLVPGRNVTLLGGNGGDGKSILGIQACCATVAGLPWIGQQPRRGNALYLSAEDDGDEVHRRIADIATFYGEPLTSFAGFKIWPVTEHDAVLASSTGRSDVIEPTQFWTEFEDFAAAWEPRLVVIDASADVFAIDENNRSQVRQAVALLRRFGIRIDTAVMLLSHPSLTGLSTGSGLSGSTAWNNSVRSRLYLSRPKASDGGASAPHIRTLTVKKANYGPSGGEYRLRLQGGAFASDDATVGAGMDRAISKMRIEQQFLELLDAFRAQGREVGESTGKAYAPSLFAEDPRAQGTTSQGFAAAMSRLFAQGQIRVEEHGPPSKTRRRIVRCDAA